MPYFTCNQIFSSSGFAAASTWVNRPHHHRLFNTINNVLCVTGQRGLITFQIQEILFVIRNRNTSQLLAAKNVMQSASDDGRWEICIIKVMLFRFRECAS